MLEPAAITEDTVSLWLATGASLGEIERELLGGALMTEERRDALWLYAWSHLRADGAARRRRARPFAGGD